MTVTSVPRFKRFFRQVAEVDVDKDDLKRYTDFVNHKIHDLLIRAEAIAKANIRDVVQPWDLPITKGLQECIHAFRKLDHDIELEPILEHLAQWPPLDLALSDETRDTLPMVFGGLSVALAHTFKVIDPALKEPHSVHWERSFQIFDLVL
jgi:hypothetical protein